MDQIDFTKDIPTKLNAFVDFKEFYNYCKDLFDLTFEEYKGLYKILIKLEGIGEDTVHTLTTWKNDFNRSDFADFVNFMIAVDTTEISDFKDVA